MIAVAMLATSALGKVLWPLPWNHRSGSAVCDGRERENVRAASVEIS
ncbi:MAG TPA: hypothetical protein VGH48_16335 [Caldimonas sp.]